jgi:hypothetical protein
MASLVDIFNPSFFMFLGILVLVAALLVVYFESKMREQNHKMASMLNLITCMADEMNAIKLHLNSHTTNNGFGGGILQPSSLDKNDIHIVKTDLIPVSDDSESDNDSENSIEDDESDNGSESSSGSNSEDNDDIKNIIEIGGGIDIGDNNDIKVLKLNISNINDIDENDENKDITDLEDLHDLEDIDDSLSLSSDSVSINEAENNNDEIDVSKLNLKSINISSLEEVKNHTNNDYKKMTLSKLRSIVVEKELVADSSKLKKNELLKLLGAE